MNSKSSRTACVEAACSATSYFDVGKNRAEEEKYHKNPKAVSWGGMPCWLAAAGPDFCTHTNGYDDDASRPLSFISCCCCSSSSSSNSFAPLGGGCSLFAGDIPRQPSWNPFFFALGFSRRFFFSFF